MSDWIPPWERRLSRLPEAPPEAGFDPLEQYPSFTEPAPVEDWFGNEVTLYGPGPGFEPYSLTQEQWFDEALLPKEILLEKYGLDNIDIMEQLTLRGMDYTYIDWDGEERSGLWRDWRDAYAEAYG